MIFINRALKDDRVIKATIGLSASEFDQLVQSFGLEIEKERWNRYERGFEQGNRERKPGAEEKGIWKIPQKNYFSFSFISSVILLSTS